MKELENRGTIQLLMFLLENGKTKITDIQIDAANSSLYNALKILASHELIDEERKPPVTRYIQLTNDGIEVAKKLLEILQILDAKKEREVKRDYR